MKHSKKLFFIFFVLLNGFCFETPLLALSPEADVPVILIPGTTRSRLQDAEGNIVWGNWSSFFRIKKDGFLEIPLHSSNPTENKDELRPAGILKKIPLFPKFLHLDSYRKFLKMMKKNGFHLGDIRAPEAGDNFFIFDYDWRLDHVENAQKLAALIEDLKKHLGNPSQKFNVIAHSSGSHIARYYLLYGGQDVLTSQKAVPSYAGASNIQKLFLIAPMHKGTLFVFQMLNEGFNPVRYLPLTFNYKPHSVFSAPAFFQMMPPYTEKIFVDYKGKDLDVDLYDADNWVRYKWSVFSKKEQARIKKISKQEHGDNWQLAFEERNLFLKEYLKNMLNRTKAFHMALDQSIPLPDSVPVTIFAARQGLTMAKVEFSPNPGRLTFSKSATKAQRFVEGDKMVTLESMLGDYSGQSNVPERVFIWEKHSRIAGNSDLHRELLSRLKTKT